MSTSRLQLDFTLDTAEERSEFLNKYLYNNPTFAKKPLTAEEAEMCGNYLLWGKNENGKNMVQEKEVQISTRSGTWDQILPESLDGLMEQPTFNEATISPVVRGMTQIKSVRETFSRKHALENAPDYLVKIFEDLFEQIDRLDLILNFYDLEHGKRKNPPRESLISKYDQETIDLLKEEAGKLSPYQYLKKRHDLVELRRQQFTYKDCYVTPIQQRVLETLDYSDLSINFDSEVPIFPMGLFDNKPISKKIFFGDLDLGDYSEDDLDRISKLYWEQQDLYEKKDTLPGYVDFENEDHLYNLYLMFYDLEDAGYSETVEGTTKYLLKTLEYYINSADLTEIQKEILTLKKQKKKNQDIANYINQKYDKSYSPNYISTIFCKKAIHQISVAAGLHRSSISNLWFEENFKKCNSCGKLMLISPDNFVRKSRSKDGFSNTCKICDRKHRQKNKGE